jgi:hypothetical protein
MPSYSPVSRPCDVCGDSLWTTGQIIGGKVLCSSCYSEASRLAQRPAFVAPVVGDPIYNGPASLPPRSGRRG